MPIVHSFDPPERFVAGTVGDPGQRTFFLQARLGPRVTSVALEKQQVAILAERMGELLDELTASGGTRAVIPAVTPGDLVDDRPLEQPIVEEFRAGTITLSWDVEDEVVVVEVFPVPDATEGPEGSSEEPLDPESYAEPEPDELLVVRLTPGQARAFNERSATVVAAGREPCPFCGNPMDPSGHLCPRANGFRRTQR